MNKKILFITCCENGFYCLKDLHKQKFYISAVVTLNKLASVKNKVSGYIDVSSWCKKNKIKCVILDKYNLENENFDEEFNQFMSNLNDSDDDPEPDFNEGDTWMR